jgi:predicted RNA-binding Zn ribbon-like protein
MDTTQREPAPGDLRLIQELVNTRDIEEHRDDLASPDLLAVWLRSHGLLAGDAPLTEADRRQVIDVREALRALLLANNGAPLDPHAVATLNRAAAAAPLHVQVEPNGQASLTSTASGVQAALGRLLAIVLTAQDTGKPGSGSIVWSRLKACRDDDCHWAFYDQSKNRSGTWCSMAVCGNRTKTRAYRQRNRPGHH